MNQTVLGVVLMLLSTSMVNLGAVLQKKAVDRLPDFASVPWWQSVKGVLLAPVWLLGWVMATSGVVLNMVALGLADISVIQPLGGFGLVVLVLASRVILGERLEARAAGGIGLVIAGVAAVGLTLPESRVFGDAGEILGAYLRPPALAALVLGAGAAGGLVRLARANTVGGGVSFALAAATCSVVGLTFSKGFFGILTVAGVGAALGSVGPLALLGLLLTFSSSAMVLQQLSFQKGRAVVVTTVFAAASVVLPLVAGRFVFGETLPAVAFLGPGLIVLGVVLIGGRVERADEDGAPVAYHDNATLLAELGRFAARVPTRARLVALGRTVEGREILAVRLAEGSGLPAVLIVGNVHGNEVIGSELALRLVELLSEPAPGPAARALLDVAEVVVVPAVNLDSRERCVAVLAGRRGQSRRGNARGVDLNRNFPWVAGARDAWHPLAGSPRRWSPWYRGTAPLSEPESRAVVDLAESLRPVASLNLHSVGRLFLHPWCYCAEPPPDVAAFQAMGEAFRAAQPRRPYTVKQANAWYAILGDMDDWLYDRFGTLAVTVELSGPLTAVPERPSALFAPAWWMNPADPAATLTNTAEACLRALACAAANGVRICVMR